MNNSCPKFGDVFFAALNGDGHVQGGIRPVVIAQNDMGNKYSPVIGVIPMTSKVDKAKHLPVHVVIPADDANGLSTDSVVLTEQMRTIPAEHLLSRMGFLNRDSLVRIGKALAIQFPFPFS
ncbi:MAG: type II toxin-antitoxin system PemK/MazF family toxin [Paludibacteraceae bacterium]